MFIQAVILSVVAASGGERAQPRVRGGIGAVFSAGFSVTPYVTGFSPGLDGALGVTVADKHGVEVRFTGGTIGISTSFMVDLAYEVALHEQILVSAGLGFGALGGGLFVSDLPWAQFVVAPARFTWLFTKRNADQRARQGFALFLELSPAVVVTSRNGYRPGGAPKPAVASPIGGMGAIGVTYSWK
jgi:hypothetical protein